jgi:hypothetical protein
MEVNELWLSAIDNLYKMVDDIIVRAYEDAGYNASNIKEKGNYLIKLDDVDLRLYPIGIYKCGDYDGRVMMILNNETIKLILHKGKWMISSGSEYGVDWKLVPFNEKNLVKLFKSNT